MIKKIIKMKKDITKFSNSAREKISFKNLNISKNFSKYFKIYVRNRFFYFKSMFELKLKNLERKFK